MRPTWALIDETNQAAGVAEGLANSVAQRREGGDRRLAQQAAEAFQARRTATRAGRTGGRGAGDGSAGSLMTMIITDWFMGAVRQSAEALSRADVERLRDLCDEALA